MVKASLRSGYMLFLFIVPLLWMIALGTVSAYFKSIFENYYSAAVQREVRSSLGTHLLKLTFSYFDEMGRFFSEIALQLQTRWFE